MFRFLKNLFRDRLLGVSRSGQWPRIRKEFLIEHSTCAVCGGNKKIEVHHKKPFSQNPELELDKDNLITLCENKKNGLNCHLLIGHLGSYKSYNENVVDDSISWYNKIRLRP